MSTDINEFQRRAQRKELDKIAREVLYSLAVQLRDVLKDDNAIDLSHVYLVLDEALQQLFQRGIAVTGSTKMFGTTNYGCPHFESLKNLPKMLHSQTNVQLALSSWNVILKELKFDYTHVIQRSQRIN